MEKTLNRSAMPTNAQTSTDDEAYQIGVEAYVYFYPLVLMDVTRRQMTNIEAGIMRGQAPVNTFAHIRSYPSADFREVVRPNFDTLYSIAWLNLSTEPMVVSTPDTLGRYYLLHMIDMWTDVFAVHGKRTSGTGAANYAVVAPGWKGTVPAGIEVIQAPTPYVWIIARIQTNGRADYAAVHKVQDGLHVTPLSQWGKTSLPAPFAADPTVDMKTPPLQQVNAMSAKAYYTYAMELMKLHPPHATDSSTIARLRRIGMEPGKSFDWNELDPQVQESLTKASAFALKSMYAKVPLLARVTNQ